MFLSSLLINTGGNPDRPRPGRLWLRNLYRVHQRLCMAFPSTERKGNDPSFLQPYAPEHFPENRYLAARKPSEVLTEDPIGTLRQVHARRDELSGFLFRIDPQTDGRAVILVQSVIEPDWDYAFHNAGYLLAAPSQVKSLDPSFALGQPLRFRLVANPTKRLGENSTGPDGNPVKKTSVGKRVPVQAEKINEWLERRASPAGFHVERLISVQVGYVYVSKDVSGKGNRLRSARYDGILKVTDTAFFRNTLMRGIGPGKAFGFGLLSVAPVRS